MRIPPTTSNERLPFYEDLLTKCLVSRSQRRVFYTNMKRYYMTGCSASDNPNVTFNKIYPHIDQLSSFMYSQETTKFAVTLDQTVSDGELSKVPTINTLANDLWHDSNSDVIFGQGLIWSFVYGTMLVKKRWARKQSESFLVEPHNFGVLREDIPMLDRQEAFVHCYTQTASELERELRIAKCDRVEEILARVTDTSSAHTLGSLSAGNIVVSSVSPLIVGNAEMNLNGTMDYRPIVQAGLVKMFELYVWNDEISDYQIVTLADPAIVVYDRPLSSMFVSNEHPFTQITPNPAPDYFWGHAEVERLVPLQDMRNERMYDVRRMMALQAKPPVTYTGFPGVTDEMNAAYNQPGGYMQSDMPGAKADLASPTIPDDLFAEMKEIDAMFEEMSGINNVLSGRGEQGVRSAGHASQLAKLGASRAKKRALIVEDALERAATLDMKIQQKFDDKQYKSEDGTQFILDQFTKDFRVKVDAHSNSPIFNEDADEKAFKLFEVKAIDREELIDMLDVPMPQLLKQRLKAKIIPGEQAAAEEEKKLRLAGVGGKKTA